MEVCDQKFELVYNNAKKKNSTNKEILGVKVGRSGK